MQCMLGRLCDCTGVLVALGGWPLPHSSSLSYLFRSLPSCTSEHLMLGWHNVASVSSFVCHPVYSFIFSVSNFSSDTSHLTETKQLFHCTSLQCCFLLSVKLYVCFAHSDNNVVFSRPYQIWHFIGYAFFSFFLVLLIAVLLLYVTLEYKTSHKGQFS